MASFGIDYSAQFRRNEIKKNLEMDPTTRNAYPKFTDWCSSQLPADATICTVPPKRPQFMTQKNLMLNHGKPKNNNPDKSFPMNVEPILAVHPGPTYHPGGPPEIYRRPPHSDMIQRRNQITDQSAFLRELKSNSRKPLNTDDTSNTIYRRKNRFAKCQSMNVDPAFDYLKVNQDPNVIQKRMINKERSVDRAEFPLPVPKAPFNYENAGAAEFAEKLSRHRNLSQNGREATAKNYYADPLNISLWADKGRHEMKSFKGDDNNIISPNNSDEIVFEFQNNNNNNKMYDDQFGNQQVNGQNKVPDIHFQPVVDTMSPLNNQLQYNQIQADHQHQAVPVQGQSGQAPYVAIVAPDLESLQALLAKNFNGANIQILSPNNNNNLLYPYAGNINSPNYQGSQNNLSYQTSYNHRQSSPMFYEFTENFETLDYHQNTRPINYERIRSKLMPKASACKPFIFQPEILQGPMEQRQEHHHLQQQQPTTRRSRKLEHSFSAEPRQQADKILKYQQVREPKKIDKNAFMNVVNGNSKTDLTSVVKMQRDIVSSSRQEGNEPGKKSANSNNNQAVVVQPKIQTKKSPDVLQCNKEANPTVACHNNDASIVSVAERAKMWSLDKNEVHRRNSHGSLQPQTKNNNFQIHNLDFDSDEIGEDNPMSVEDRILMLKLNTNNQENSNPNNKLGCTFSPDKSCYQQDQPESAIHTDINKVHCDAQKNRLDTLRKTFNSVKANQPDSSHVSRVNKSAYQNQRFHINQPANHQIGNFQKARSTTRTPNHVSQPSRFEMNPNPRNRFGHGTSSHHNVRRKTQPITLEDLELANQYILDGNESDIFDSISVSCQPEGSDIFNLDDGQSEIA